jgi:hypothetical protein
VPHRVEDLDDTAEMPLVGSYNNAIIGRAVAAIISPVVWSGT